MVQDRSPLSRGALNSATLITMVEAFTQTYEPSPEQKSLLHDTRASLLGQDKPEMNGVNMTGGLLNDGYNNGESVMDLKIRLAVLENDLAHKERERKEAVSACGIIATVLGPGYAGGFTDASIKAGDDEVQPSAGKWRPLEQKVKMLQKENALLWRSLDATHTGRKGDQLVYSDDEILNSKVRERLVSAVKGKPNEFNTRETSVNGEFVPGDRQSGFLPHIRRNHAPTDFRHTSANPASPTASINDQGRPITPDTVDEETRAWGQGSVSRTTTVPNSPVIPANIIFHSRISSRDIGFESLDDVLGPEESDLTPPVCPPQSLINATKASQLLEGGPGIDEEMKKYMDSMILPEDLPTPTVLKTGFDLKGSFKGGKYTHMIPTGPRTWSHFYRSGNVVLSKSHNSSLSYEGPINLNGEFGSPFVGKKEGLAGAHRSSFGGGFFRYGIRYLPSETDSNYMRRIIISNLPKDVELRDVLGRVRGGEIVSANLLDTEKLTGGMTVMVQFLCQGSAEEYLAYTKDHPIHFGCSDQKAEIAWVKTPTWPLTTGPYPSILQNKQTRCLAIPEFPNSLSIAALESHITGRSTCRTAALLNIYTDNQGALHFEFSSMFEAQYAYEILTQWPKYAGLKPIFTSDPCARSMEELASPPAKISENSSAYRVGQSKPNVAPGEHGKAGNNKSHATDADQIITIPPFSGSNIISSSWADEMIEEVGDETIVAPSQKQTDSNISFGHPILSPLLKDDKDECADRMLRAVVMDNLNQEKASKEHRLRKPPVGLPGSKYATIIPRFSDLPVAHKLKQTIFYTSTENNAPHSAMANKTLPNANYLGGMGTGNESLYITEDTTRNDTKHPSAVLDLEPPVGLSHSETGCPLQRPQTIPCAHPGSLPQSQPRVSSSNIRNLVCDEDGSAPFWAPLGTSVHGEQVYLSGNNIPVSNLANEVNNKIVTNADVKATNEARNPVEVVLDL